MPEHGEKLVLAAVGFVQSVIEGFKPHGALREFQVRFAHGRIRSLPIAGLGDREPILDMTAAIFGRRRSAVEYDWQSTTRDGQQGDFGEPRSVCSAIPKMIQEASAIRLGDEVKKKRTQEMIPLAAEQISAGCVHDADDAARIQAHVSYGR
ncbi:hypothetical protein sS8_0347 [Methylocaldum marinum]|uniref:Uncharacterized protein n=1 Tax=Methylocaldum marinum TaxID=1432792 RepID=A0A286P3U3_9GAMM|nr:hypothetical protein sS8_0347 [Methylocaldum marinum]